MPTLAITIPEPIIRDGVEYCNPECQFYGYFCPATGKRLELVHFDGGKGSEPMQASAGRIRPEECRAFYIKCDCGNEATEHQCLACYSNMLDT